MHNAQPRFQLKIINVKCNKNKRKKRSTPPIKRKPVRANIKKDRKFGATRILFLPIEIVIVVSVLFYSVLIRLFHSNRIAISINSPIEQDIINKIT